MLKVAAEQLFQFADEMQHLLYQLQEETESLHRVQSALEGLQPTQEICRRLREKQTDLEVLTEGLNRAVATLRLAAEDYTAAERQIELAALLRGVKLIQPTVTLLNQADLQDITIHETGGE